MSDWQSIALETIANELKNIREILEKQSSSRYVIGNTKELKTEKGKTMSEYRLYRVIRDLDGKHCGNEYLGNLVTCRECVHCADDYIDVGMGTMPQFTCELGRCGESVQPNDFCSYGESINKNDLGNCNICRFVGCSECDDCINGSQWVRMTKDDEVDE